MRRRAEVRRGRSALVGSVSRASSASGVFSAASDGLRRLVPFDAAAWIGTDPETALPSSPVRIDGLEGVSHAMCSDHWEHELLADDVNRFRDLARSPVPAAALRLTVGDPVCSRRYRSFLRPLGLGDELRAVLWSGEAVWGTVTLWRRDDRSPFTAPDTALVASVAPAIGAELRRHHRSGGVSNGPTQGGDPGLLLFDSTGELVSVNDPARAWLDELPADAAFATDHGVRLPLWLLTTVFRAGAVRHDQGDGSATTRVRTQSGRWLSCSASCLRRPDGTFGDTAVVVAPAVGATVAPVVAAAHGSTERERQVVGYLARGYGTAELAEALSLSPHTVRDHVKSVLAKVGVSSRGELVARIYAEFYEVEHAAEVVRAGP